MSVVISPDADTEFKSETNGKRRIASVAPVVIGLSEIDARAKTIVDKAIKELIELLESLHPPAGAASATVALVLTGGLLQSRTFKSKLTSGISKIAALGSRTICVPEPADAGADYLLEHRPGK